MTIRKQSSQPAKRLNRTANRQSGIPDAMDGTPGLEILQELIDAERDNLSKAESLLGCLVISMEHGSWEHEDEVAQPYYADVARMARELVRQSINALDPLHVEKHLHRRRIKDEAEPWGDDLRSGAAGLTVWWLVPHSHNSMSRVHS
jgi:hypothetical protein